MTSTTAATREPSLRETYHPEENFQLYPYRPPAPPTDERCSYGDSPTLEEVTDRYAASIKERITVPSTPDVSITLEKCFHSSTHNITHVWLVRVQASSQSTYPSQLVAKIYDPVWFDDAFWFDPFKLRDRSVSQEVESYLRFKRFQGTKVPRFYGHFITPLPSQQNRTVNVILMQYIPGLDLRHLVPPDIAGMVCAMHKDAVVEAVLELQLDMDACGVRLLDRQSRNVILLPPKECREFCASPTCPLHTEADCDDLEIVMIDFEMVEFREPKWIHDDRRALIDNLKPKMLRCWLEGDM